ncbi:HAMP domain-containing sensor histidine kinase [Chryseobacterium gotjawalense]|uniref:histidine kinase n=1 Tax=Chryseobacterium gotjawalense TaxID=3042315 RepID=A0ABY8RCU5_9FLAO|nr:HAMP domain-containing sensor histidine kinase [Chryseobacterium sp. wdc7]WHF51810.1 HAMP domain-containing sensor histidine kinase [Chryseobacterium sp. wdc7]
MKLTHYISLRYIGVTILVMLISIPLFYVAIQNVLTHNIDESLAGQKNFISEKLQHLPSDHFVNFDDRISIEKNPRQLLTEKIFTSDAYHKEDDEIESYRILEFPVKTTDGTFNVRIRQSLVESEDLMKSILYLLISVFVALTATLLLINIQVKKRVWKPFYHTLDQLKKFRVDHAEGLHLARGKINELNDLNDSLNELAATNKKVFQSQKEFTENASHELQTPLAIIQNNIELFWQTDFITEQQAEILNDISTATTRMRKLNQALLLLSKIENKQFTNIQPVNFNLIVDTYIKNYQEQIKFKNLSLKKDFSEVFIVEIDFGLAEILVGNLFFNALKYAPQESEVEVIIHKNELKIANHAEGSALDQHQLFKRFQRQNTHEKGNGLGLEIAKEIAAAFHLDLKYQFENHQHQFILNRQ